MKLAILLAAAAAAAASIGHAAPGARAASELKLERVVMLMRHGVRPPTKEPPLPAGTTTQPWPKWSAKLGELTPHGAEGAKLVGRFDRLYYASRGLLPEQDCPAAGEVAVATSAKQRTLATAQAFVAGAFPGCAVTIEHPPMGSDDDPIFHPLDANSAILDADAALRAAEARLPPGGIAEVAQAHAADLRFLDEVLGCCTAPACPTSAQSCDLPDLTPRLAAESGDGPSVEGSLGVASTASQTILLEYLDGMPMAEVGWGKVSRGDIERLLKFHSLKYEYEGRVPYVADRSAAPVARRMLQALTAPDGARLTLLVGHDTNIGQFGGMLDLHWKIDSYPADNPPPGGAVGFELLSDANGGKYVRAFYQSQTMDQLRNLTPLDLQQRPYYGYIALPGCGSATEPCSLAQFQAIVQRKLMSPAPAPPEN